MSHPEVGNTTSLSCYTPLDKSQEQIRLLSFVYNKTIALQLRTFDIATCPAYDALSYTWGPNDASTNHEICLNGKPFVVRSNLHDALKAFEAKSRYTPVQSSSNAGLPRYLWIDALCIDQESDLERNHQVCLMKIIYSRADHVLVWLGAECENALTLGDVLEALEADDANAVVEYLKKEARRDLEPLFESSYWRRAWTVQEFELAKDITFAAGSRELDIRVLRHTVEIVYSPNLDSISGDYESLVDRYELVDFDGIRKISSKALNILNRLRNRGYITAYSLEALIYKFKTMESSDPKDTIYGLLGLASCNRANDDTPLLQVDYTLSPRQLVDRLNELGIKPWTLSQTLQDAARDNVDFDNRDHFVRDQLVSQADALTEPKLEVVSLPTAEEPSLEQSSLASHIHAPRVTPESPKAATHSRMSSLSGRMASRRRTSSTTSVSEALMQSTSVAYGATMPTLALWDADSRNVE